MGMSIEALNRLDGMSLWSRSKEVPSWDTDACASWLRLACPLSGVHVEIASTGFAYIAKPPTP
eukprot:5380815-Amphidinium_carterae.1